jgi:hypothetical protein
MLGVWRRPASVHCAAAPPVGLWGTRWPVVRSLPRAGRAALTSPRSLRTMARHHSTAWMQRLDEGRWPAQSFGAGAQRQPRAVMIQRHQCRTRHRRQWRSCATAASPPSTPTGDESRRKEAGVRRRCRRHRRQLVPAAFSRCPLQADPDGVCVCARPQKSERTSAFCALESVAAQRTLSLGTDVVSLLLPSLLP